jgi:hypothetical protein
MRFLKNFYIPLILFAVAILTYWDLPKTFFQQDEWLGFGRMMSYEVTGGVGNVLLIPFFAGRGHFTPLSYYQMYLEFKLFGLSFEQYAIISVFTHIVNSILVFYLVSLLLKNKFLAFCSSLIFSVEVISSQAVTWIAASPSTQGAVLFLLLSLIFILKYFQTNKKRNYYIVLSLFFVGLLFKETIIFFFILAPIMWFIFGQKKSRKNFVWFLKPLIILGFIYVLIRIFLFLIPSPIGLTSMSTVNLSLTEDIRRLALLPFKILPQAIIPQQCLINISDIATLLFFPQYAVNGVVSAYYSQTVVFGWVIPLLSIPILLIGFIVYKFFLIRKEIIFSKAVIFSLLLIMLSGLPFAFIPGELANAPILEPRDIHAAVIGTSIFLPLILYGLVRIFLKQKKIIYLLVFCLLFPIIFIHIALTRNVIDEVVKMSIPRIYILRSIKTSYPKLPQKVVFFTQSDTAYYGMPIEEKALPVQLNFGTILLVWYQKDENFPPCLFDFNPEAFHMLTQRYKECGGRGFGYFRDYDKLVIAIKENNISVNDIIAYSWKGKAEELTDITGQIRSKIKQDIFYDTAK